MEDLIILAIGMALTAGAILLGWHMGLRTRYEQPTHCEVCDTPLLATLPYGTVCGPSCDRVRGV